MAKDANVGMWYVQDMKQKIVRKVIRINELPIFTPGIRMNNDN